MQIIFIYLFFLSVACSTKPCPETSQCEDGPNNTFKCKCKTGYKKLSGSGPTILCQGNSLYEQRSIRSSFKMQPVPVVCPSENNNQLFLGVDIKKIRNGSRKYYKFMIVVQNKEAANRGVLQIICCVLYKEAKSTHDSKRLNDFEEHLSRAISVFMVFQRFLLQSSICKAIYQEVLDEKMGKMGLNIHKSFLQNTSLDRLKFVKLLLKLLKLFLNFHSLAKQ